MKYLLLIGLLVAVIITAGCVNENKKTIADGDKLFNESKYEEAFLHYDKAIIDNPKNAEGWIKRGAALDKLQRYREAIDSISKGVSLNETVCEPRLNGMCILTIHPNKTYFAETKITLYGNKSSLTIDTIYCDGNKCLIDLRKFRDSLK